MSHFLENVLYAFKIDIMYNSLSIINLKIDEMNINENENEYIIKFLDEGKCCYMFCFCDSCKRYKSYRKELRILIVNVNIVHLILT